MLGCAGKLRRILAKNCSVAMWESLPLASRNTMRKHLSHIPVDAIASQGHPLEIVPLEVVLVPGLLCDVSIWAAQIAALKPYADVARRPLPTTGQPGDYGARSPWPTARHRRMGEDLVFRSFTFCKNLSGAVVKLTPCFCHGETACCAIETDAYTALDPAAFDSRSSAAAPMKERI